ncbi:MAG: hypothetical protein HFK09_04625 [Clostridia bacterium]|nr:hypothetical protein [Clostridia bacterium]
MDIRQSDQTKSSGLLHSLSITDRKNGTVEGVNKVVSANPETVNLITSRGALSICGKDLRILKFDADTGKLSLEGEINSLKYEGGKKPLLKRIFR